MAIMERVKGTPWYHLTDYTLFFTILLNLSYAYIASLQLKVYSKIKSFVWWYYPFLVIQTHFTANKLTWLFSQMEIICHWQFKVKNCLLIADYLKSIRDSTISIYNTFILQKLFLPTFIMISSHEHHFLIRASGLISEGSSCTHFALACFVWGSGLVLVDINFLRHLFPAGI